MLLTLPLDLIALLFIPQQPLLSDSNLLIGDVITLCAAVTVLLLSKSDSASIFHAMRKVRSRPKLILLGAALLAAIGLIGVAHVFVPILGRALNGQGLGVAIVISSFIVLAIFRTIKEQFILVRQRMAASVLTKNVIDDSHRDILLISILPSVLARVISISGVVRVVLCAGSSITLFCYSAVSLLLLLSVEPHRKQFIGSCRYCLSAVSVSITHLGICPQCAQRSRKR